MVGLKQFKRGSSLNKGKKMARLKRKKQALSGSHKS
jgi:hypothetical protein